MTRLERQLLNSFENDFSVCTWVGEFTTGRKVKTTIDISRKGSIVKEKCRQLTEIVVRVTDSGVISTKELQDLVEDYCGADKETVRAYVGYMGRIRRSKRTGEGYIVGERRKGYLEKFGFMHQVTRDTWKVSQTMLTEFLNKNEVSGKN